MDSLRRALREAQAGGKGALAALEEKCKELEAALLMEKARYRGAQAAVETGTLMA